MHFALHPRKRAHTQKKEVTFVCCLRRLDSRRCLRLCNLSFVALPVSTFFRFFLRSIYYGVSEVLLRICEDVYQADEASDDDDMSRSSDGD